MKSTKTLISVFILLALVLMTFSCNKKTTEPDAQTVATPTFNPPGGSYSSTQNVTISCASSGATIRYTTNGNTPTESSTAYSGPLTVSQDTTIKAKAFMSGWTPSSTASADYTIDYPETVATPTFNPPGGSYPSPQNVIISCATSGATIHYTTDDSEPTVFSSLYSSPITVSQSTTIKAKAFMNGWTPSSRASATYAINITPPDQMVYVSGGTFHNGTSNVTVSSFYIGKYELTQAEYAAVMGTNPSFLAGNPNHPVEQVSWFNAIEYCNRRSIMEGLTPCYSYDTYGSNPDSWPSGWNSNDENHTNISCDWTANGYRLPTEMEWMFAAKGGNQSQGYTYSGSNNIGDVAWYSGNSGSTTHAVGTKAPNELGIYDMTGNVWEWCWDIDGYYPDDAQTDPHGASSGSFRMSRGGSWSDYAYVCVISDRSMNEATDEYVNLGFRVCRNAP